MAFPNFPKFFIVEFLKISVLVFVGVYVLALPALALQGRILFADGLIPLEAGLCTAFSVIVLGWACWLTWGLVRK